MYRALSLTVHACFFMAGACGLTYEIAWSRCLEALTGDAAFAHTAVLATFMGGLALGAFVFGPLADRVPHGLRTYGWLETCVGLYAAVFPWIFSLVERVGGSLGAALGILALLPPTMLMGGTLPILTRALTASTADLRRSVSTLYALNSAGSVVGGLVAGFVLLEALGASGTLHLVGLANAALGLFVLALARAVPSRAAVPAAEVTSAEAPDAARYGPAEQRAALLLAGFSGFATMALEIAWIRWFGSLLGSSSDALTLMLAAFISGIALGSFWLSSARGGRVRLLPLLGGALFATALFLTISVAFYDRLPAFLATLHPLSVYAVCFLVMLLPTVVAGIVFPATVRLAATQTRMGGGIGRVYAVNTLGTLAGAIVTSTGLYPWLGADVLFRVLIVAYCLAGGALAWRFRPRSLLPAALERIS